MNACEYLAGQRVNVELILWINDKNILHYGVRIRPWKQETRIGAMILAQGLSVDDALKNAARELYLAHWERLDYSARPWLSRTPETPGSESPVQLDFLQLTDTVQGGQPIPFTIGSKKPIKSPDDAA
jgi:hypothetical protein